ncbi:undecaprenyldiphospho-muramoylpentapeptide beta-N-acetylglucosaminyltransferase [Geoalkalibacter halelectricus]|uniref:UDP-N-acetylglucosamine--N-acetylmuramyl-(pentapeptide) pyrophosphoryl-undecaprenol N-acetylglucosamine transferase n=1 Tax=Geoalkalibacter halelectricus TaxID=2847045 RepID=A0ABY5ZQ73_9BACT|nr:undecaprenyldiphospho-muramoylpentapeptide beta-N-acetylglucosaminyltransferase [Geoalkalibacter halelectricus]MDO3378830.1 undecaprenyldiphospho-muramoylpentapeptide beta-N-acetylglucosaminyltransferase [Geoalkalibacter halelectricus]UWZ79864.1 undecaprenyldiphospho-muramoylpentapeptide beta-N-acetylglucosaminyltransferase [Geoalkalibacter halelectricus]
MRLLLAGGGTGGHLFPAVALAEQLLREDPQGQVLFVGTERGLESRILPRLGFELRKIDISGFVGKGWGRKLALIPQLFKSLRQSRAILREFQPDVVVGVGGYASGPLLAAALLMRYPVLIHEQNAWPGLTNRLLAPWVRRVCLSFPETGDFMRRATKVVTGNPVRLGLAHCPPPPNGAPHLLVFGGSLGARAINDAMLNVLPELSDLKDQVTLLHQTGEDDFERVRSGYQAAGWNPNMVVPFIEDMAAAYAKSHLVLCRAGATTLAELTACGRAAILVPYPHAANDHQTANAQALAEKGAALLLPQAQLNAARLGQLLRELLADPPLLASMAGAAHALGKRDAAAAILKECRAIAQARPA